MYAIRHSRIRNRVSVSIIPVELNTHRQRPHMGTDVDASAWYLLLEHHAVERCSVCWLVPSVWIYRSYRLVTTNSEWLSFISCIPNKFARSLLYGWWYAKRGKKCMKIAQFVVNCFMCLSASYFKMHMWIE